MTLLIYLAYSLVIYLTYTRTQTRRPHWQLRAELVAMAAGLTILILLALLTYPHYPHVPYQSPPPITA